VNKPLRTRKCPKSTSPWRGGRSAGSASGLPCRSSEGAKASGGNASRRHNSYGARSAKGWTPERRARQAEHIRLAQPWTHSTGPKTDAGKARVAMNALRHGYRGRAWLERARRILNAIRLCAETMLLARALMLQQGGSAHCKRIGQIFPPPLAESRGPISDSGAVAGPNASNQESRAGDPIRRNRIAL
jgi:hypothetical protein